MAAGLSLARDQVAAFAQSFEGVARKALSDDDLTPVLLYDGVTLLDELDLGQVTALEQLAPFGMGNPEPVLLIEKVRARQLQRVGEGHLRFIACQGGDTLPAIAFGMAARLAEFQGDIDLLVSPQINRYKDRETVQLRVRDVRKADE
jgi:single-stranded-DNA-specific exonuclease